MQQCAQALMARAMTTDPTRDDLAAQLAIADLTGARGRLRPTAGAACFVRPASAHPSY